MKIGTLIMATLLLTGSAFWARIVSQGLLPALVSTAVERGMSRMRGGARR